MCVMNIEDSTAVHDDGARLDATRLPAPSHAYLLGVGGLGYRVEPTAMGG